MTGPDVVWGGLIAAGVLYEAYALRNKRREDTLSEATRRAFRVHNSRTGKTVFVVLWVGFATWFTGHVANWWW